VEEAGLWFRYLGNGYYEYHLAANPKSHMSVWAKGDYWHVTSPGRRKVKSTCRTAAVLEMALKIADEGCMTEFEMGCLRTWYRIRQMERNL